MPPTTKKAIHALTGMAPRMRRANDFFLLSCFTMFGGLTGKTFDKVGRTEVLSERNGDMVALEAHLLYHRYEQGGSIGAGRLDDAHLGYAADNGLAAAQWR